MQVVLFVCGEWMCVKSCSFFFTVNLLFPVRGAFLPALFAPSIRNAVSWFLVLLASMSSALPPCDLVYKPTIDQCPATIFFKFAVAVISSMNGLRNKLSWGIRFSLYRNHAVCACAEQSGTMKELAHDSMCTVEHSAAS